MICKYLGIAAAMGLGCFGALLASEQNEKVTSSTTLKFEGEPGIRFFGICTSTDSPQEKRIEGITPAEISVDVSFSKCKLEKVAEKDGDAKVTLRVFQGRKEIQRHDDIPPRSGIEIAIPFGFKSKKK